MSEQLPSTPIPERTPPDHVGVLITSAIMMVGGWWGLYQLVTTTRPYPQNQWVFLFLLQIAVTGTVLPFVRYFNVRFTPVRNELPPGGVIVRQSVWFGLFIATCAWLQIPRVLSLPIVFFLALMFIVIEIILRSRELAHEREE